MFPENADSTRINRQCKKDNPTSRAGLRQENSRGKWDDNEFLPDGTPMVNFAVREEIGTQAPKVPCDRQLLRNNGLEDRRRCHRGSHSGFPG